MSTTRSQSSLIAPASGRLTTGDQRVIVLRNVAAWHVDRHEEAARAGKTEIAERHDAIAYRLFKQARELGGRI